jgi:elongation factor 1-alpha
MIILFTKIDLGEKCPEVMNEALSYISRIFSRPGVNRSIFRITDENDVITAGKVIRSGEVIPLIFTSNVRGDGLKLLHELFNLLRPRGVYDSTAKVEFHVHDTFVPRGVGLVIGGFLKKGTLKVDSRYHLGPTSSGEYLPIRVRSLHVNRSSVSEASAGRYVCVAVPRISREEVSTGMVILEDTNACTVCSSFSAEVIVFRTHHTTIRIGYETVLHINSLRTTVKLIGIRDKRRVRLKKSVECTPGAAEATDEEGTLRLGDRAIIRLEFKNRKCFLSVGDRVFLAESRIKMTGRVVDIH